jgi:nucleoid-associated protein YgaU
VGWFATDAWAEPGTVTVTLGDWEAAGAERRGVEGPPAPAGPLPIRRTLVGALDRGLFVGTLTSTFDVYTAGPVVVVDGASVLADVRLDGAPASARRDGEGWVVDAAPGRHELRVELLQGERSDRFTRALQLTLPAGGPTALELRIPEASIDPTLRGGVVVSAVSDGRDTLLRGWLDAAGRVDLTWERDTGPAVALGAARVEAEVDSVLSLRDDVVVGVARYGFEVREGEVDRFELALPPEVEVLEVSGGQVLQWHTDARGRLVGLLRSVADAQVEATVRFQYPVTPDAPVPLRVPVPVEGVTFRGALGVEAPAGLDVAPEQAGSATLLEPRDVPRAVLALTREPLRSVWSFDQAPDATVRVHRQADVAVSSSRVDDLQALTVLVEDGTEVGKLLLQVRNTTRQVLTVELPAGARLTHCFRDGVPLRPAAVEGHPERILVPLTRSAPGAKTTHTVASGDMLSSLALRYYGDANAWKRLLDANPTAAGGLRVGDTLVIPPIEAAVEQAFALELGWERASPRLGFAGRRAVALPRLDLEVMAANWHLYLPDPVEPLSISGDGPLALVDTLHTDPLARLWSAAFAGEGYSSVLGYRRKLFADEERKAAETAGDPFPLVGQRIRLRGVFLGTEPASAVVTFVTAPVAQGVRLIAGVVAAVGAFSLARRPGRGALVGAAVTGLVCLIAAHHVLGVHRALAWGVNAGLLAELAAAVFAGGRWAWGRPRASTVAVGALVVFGGLCLGNLFPVWVGLGLVAARRRLS